MNGLSCLTFVLVAFCCYGLSATKPARTEAGKHQDLPQQQQQQQQHQHPDHELKTETRHKRSQLDMANTASIFGTGEYRNPNEFLEELGDNTLLATSLMPQSQEVENMSPLVYYMLLQELKQMQANERQISTRRTPRLGRSIDFQLFDAAANGGAANGNGATAAQSSRDFEGVNMGANDYAALSRQFLPRVMKKSVQFKPRLGKRTQVCD